MIKHILTILTLLLPFAVQAQLASDPYSGTNNMLLDAYDGNYENARVNYNVDHLALDGAGNVKISTAADYDGGFAYVRTGSQRNNGQISQMTLLTRNGAAMGAPFLRLLVQTTSAGSQYYGVQLQNPSGGNYADYHWYRGADFITGMTFVPVTGTYSVSASVVVRLVTQMVSATVQRVTFYMGVDEENLVEQSWIQVTDGSGMTSSSESTTDATVPWSVGGWPGMLYYGNVNNTNSLFTDFTDGISWNSPAAGSILRAETARFGTGVVR